MDLRPVVLSADRKLCWFGEFPETRVHHVYTISESQLRHRNAMHCGLDVGIKCMFTWRVRMTCGSTTKVFARFSPQNWKIRHEMDVLLFLRVSQDAMRSYLVRDVLFFVIIGVNFLVVKTPSLVKQPWNHRKTFKITKVCYPLYNILNGEINALIFEIWVSICLIYSNRQKTENFHRSARSVKSCAVEELPFYSL